MTKRTVGQPTKMTTETVQILETSWALGATDTQACFRAGISRQTLQNYVEKYPEYLDRKAAMKSDVDYRAKALQATEIQHGNIQQANKYLDRQATRRVDVTSDGAGLTTVINLIGVGKGIE
jgi:hypothetical protein